MAYSEEAVNEVVGKPRSDYQCNHVVNKVLNGDKWVGGTASSYLHYGQLTITPAAGVVVVGKDGVHVGVFISPTEFIHSSSTKGKVIRAPLSQLPYVFPHGYMFRTK
jgi:hypothetical protein